MISEHDPGCVGDCSGRLVGKFVNKQSILVAREGCDGPVRLVGPWKERPRSRGSGPIGKLFSLESYKITQNKIKVGKLRHLLFPPSSRGVDWHSAGSWIHWCLNAKPGHKNEEKRIRWRPCCCSRAYSLRSGTRRLQYRRRSKRRDVRVVAGYFVVIEIAGHWHGARESGHQD